MDLAKYLMTVALHLVEHANSVLEKLVLSLLQLCKQAANHPGGADILGRKQRALRCVWTVFRFHDRVTFPAEAAGSCLGELGPVDFSSIALLRGQDAVYKKAASPLTSTESQCLYIVLNCMNDALTQQRYGSPGIKSSKYVKD